ncbi:hypothetical protein ADUPG1_003368, partial [Aduncisulcus paluster]
VETRAKIIMGRLFGLCDRDIKEISDTPVREEQMNEFKRARWERYSDEEVKRAGKEFSDAREEWKRRQTRQTRVYLFRKLTDGRKAVKPDVSDEELKGLLKKAYEEKQKVVERERKEAKYLNEIETADRIAKEKRRLHDEKFPVMKPEEEVRKGKRYVDGIARSAEAWKRIREGCAREDDWECVNIREEDETKIKQLMGEVKKSPEGRVTSRRIPKSKCSSTI